MEVGQFKVGSVVRVDDVERGSPQELLSPVSLSYKELLAYQMGEPCAPCRPTWFASHWWGEPVLDFVRCCEKHAEVRGLAEDEATYWVCAYANRQ